MDELDQAIQEMLSEMEEKKQEHLKTAGIGATPHLGIFWYLDGEILSESKPVDKIPTFPSTTKVQYLRAHQDVWPEYVRENPKLGYYNRLARSLNQESAAFTFPPRGRVSAVKNSDGGLTFVLFISPVLNKPGFIERIKKLYHLEDLKVVPDKTHYGTDYTGETKEDFGGKLAKFTK